MDQSPYASALGALASGPPPPPPGGAGPMPTGPVGMPGPPMPSGTGAMGTGDPMHNPRASASAAILALRGLKNHFGAAGDRIDGMIAEVQALSSPPKPMGGDAPSPGGGMPPMPPIDGAGPLAPPPVGM